MASSSSSYTLQPRELFSLSICNCKCFSISNYPFVNSPSSLSLKPTFSSKLSLFLFVKTPVCSNTKSSSCRRRNFTISAQNNNNNNNYSSAEEATAFRTITHILGSEYSSSGSLDFEQRVLSTNGKTSERSNFGKGSEKKSYGVSSSRYSNKREGRKMEGILRKLPINIDGHDKTVRRGSGFSSEGSRNANSGSFGVNGDVGRGRKFIKEKNSDSEIKAKKKKKEKLSKKSKDHSPLFQLRLGLDMCSKKGDVLGAISLYDVAVKEGVKMGQYHYTVLLYLCSSASMGVVRPAKSGSGSRSLDTVAEQTLDEEIDSEDDDDDVDDTDDDALDTTDQTQKVETVEIRVSDDVKKYALQKGFEIYERMCLDKVQMNEAALTSVARMAMAMGKGDMAFDMVKQMKSMGINPKLRSYGPALSAFSSSGDIEKAFTVEKHMLENGVCPEEPELEALLRVSVETGKADRVYYLLHKLRTDVRSVSPSTADLIEKWFKSKEASRVGKRKWDPKMIAEMMDNVGGGWHGQGWLGSGKWTVARTFIGADGLCKCCGEKLALIDLDPAETEKFAESVASIAIKREKNSSFQKFQVWGSWQSLISFLYWLTSRPIDKVYYWQRWLDYYGPFEAVVDAANVGLFSLRKFRPSKVNAVVNGIRQMLPSRKWPLIAGYDICIIGE